MQTASDDFLKNDIPEFTSQLAEFEKKIEPLSHPDNEEYLQELEGIMAFGLNACRNIHRRIHTQPQLLKQTQELFRSATAPWCQQSWIINRARTKPRGFPGDYQMLLAIYDGVPLARGIGGYLDRWCLKMTLGRAVNARLHNAKSFLVDELSRRTGTLQVLDIASGPGREFQLMRGMEFDCRVTMTCVDTDDGALEYVRRHVSTRSPKSFQFRLVNHNAFRLRSPENVIKMFGRQDIIYSVGLADYIPDRLLIPMLSSWRESLNPEGCVYVGFKDRNHYDHVEYDWLMDWNFVQRDEAHCCNLLEQAGYDRNLIERHRDSTGVIVTYLARPHVSQTLRLDRLPQQMARFKSAPESENASPLRPLPN